MTHDTTHCETCSKPLGATRPTCFACGGTTDRGDQDRITNDHWQALGGIF